MFNKNFLNLAVYEIMWKNIVEQERPQMTIWWMRISRWVLRAAQSHTQTHTLRICNTYRISTAKITARSCRNATLYVPCVLFFLQNDLQHFP